MSECDAKIWLMSSPKIGTWMQRWPDLLDGLSNDQRRAVTNAVASNVLEGWDPSRAHIQALVDLARGDITIDDYTASVRASSVAPPRPH